MLVGGKTGTGDNRYQTSARGGGPISSRAVDRTATFVFFLGDRFFGTVTAYVAGPEADRYHFTSALAVRVLKALEPALRPLINANQEFSNIAPVNACAVRDETSPRMDWQRCPGLSRTASVEPCKAIVAYAARVVEAASSAPRKAAMAPGPDRSLPANPALASASGL